MFFISSAGLLHTAKKIPDVSKDSPGLELVNKSCFRIPFCLAREAVRKDEIRSPIRDLLAPFLSRNSACRQKTLTRKSDSSKWETGSIHLPAGSVLMLKE